MGSSMRPTIFNDRVATALKSWHHTARKHVRHNNKDSNANTPFSSRPATPTHGMSPVHLLHKHTGGHSDSPLVSPRASSSYENDEQWGVEGSLNSPRNHERDREETLQMQALEQHAATELPPSGLYTVRSQHEISLSEFSFGNGRGHTSRD